MSARKYWGWGVVSAAVLAIATGFGLLHMARPSAVLPAPVYALLIRGAEDDRLYYLTGAHSAAEQSQGLGNLPAMARDRGMVFVYDGQDRRCFWMKDMRFAIDIIWLDTRKQVTHIEPSVSPATYPKVFCHPAQYVIELNAGEAARGSLKAGRQLSF